MGTDKPPAPRGRVRDFGVGVGYLKPGPQNAITDVAGVRVGHSTVWREEPCIRTGVTAIWPHEGNPFRERVYAATSVFNGYGILTSDLVVEEWGMLGSPIILCDTRHVGVCYEAAVSYMSRLDDAVGVDDVLMPVVAECDDGYLNDNRVLGLRDKDVHQALEEATSGPVGEGAVGAGTGTQQFDFKGGIGTASRVIEIGGREYTIGVLLNTNYGSRHQLQIAGTPVGMTLHRGMPQEHREGSCIGVVATDLPLHPRQLKRLARRVDAGLIRTGSVGNDGSGEIFIAFTTAHRVPRRTTSGTINIDVLVEGQFWTHGSPMDLVFEAVTEATEEAALNALFQADTVRGRDGHVLEGFPIDEGVRALTATGRS
ncbi:MAG: P1 family peptidase [Rubrobacteraceae bacterium]|nr:P1 family peptidase [Rubrobacteraceae bacterium]